MQCKITALGTSPREKACNIITQRLQSDKTKMKPKSIAPQHSAARNVHTSMKLCTESIRMLNKVWAMSIYMDYTPTRGWLEPTQLPECTEALSSVQPACNNSFSLYLFTLT